MKAIKIIHVTKEEFQNSIKEVLRNEIDPLFSRMEPREPEELLTRGETANLLKINLSTLWHWTNKRKLFSYSIGNRVYYKRSEIDKALIKIN